MRENELMMSLMTGFKISYSEAGGIKLGRTVKQGIFCMNLVALFASLKIKSNPPTKRRAPKPSSGGKIKTKVQKKGSMTWPVPPIKRG